MLGVVKVPLQGTEQRRRAFFGARYLADQAGEQIQLARAGHGPIALRWQRLVPGVQRFVGQCHVGIPAGTLPERHDDALKVLLHEANRLVNSGWEAERGTCGIGWRRHGRGDCATCYQA